MTETPATTETETDAVNAPNQNDDLQPTPPEIKSERGC